MRGPFSVAVMLGVWCALLSAETAHAKTKKPVPAPRWLRIEHLRGDVRMGSPSGKRVLGEQPLVAGQKLFVSADATVQLAQAGIRVWLSPLSAVRVVSPTELEVLRGAVRLQWQGSAPVRQLSTGIAGFVARAPRDSADLLTRVLEKDHQREVSFLVRSGELEIQRVSHDAIRAARVETLRLFANDEYAHSPEAGGPFAPRRIDAGEVSAISKQLGF